MDKEPITLQGLEKIKVHFFALLIKGFFYRFAIKLRAKELTMAQPHD